MALHFGLQRKTHLAPLLWCHPSPAIDMVYHRLINTIVQKVAAEFSVRRKSLLLDLLLHVLPIAIFNESAFADQPAAENMLSIKRYGRNMVTIKPYK